MKRYAFVVALALALVACAACGGSSTSPSTTPPVPTELTISGFSGNLVAWGGIGYATPETVPAGQAVELRLDCLPTGAVETRVLRIENAPPYIGTSMDGCKVPVKFTGAGARVILYAQSRNAQDQWVTFRLVAPLP